MYTSDCPIFQHGEKQRCKPEHTGHLYSLGTPALNHRRFFTRRPTGMAFKFPDRFWSLLQTKDRHLGLSDNSFYLKNNIFCFWTSPHTLIEQLHQAMLFLQDIDRHTRETQNLGARFSDWRHWLVRPVSDWRHGDRTCVEADPGITDLPVICSSRILRVKGGCHANGVIVRLAPLTG